MAQVTIKQPSRTTMRMIFELALRGAMLPATQGDVTEAATWHELMWKRDDQAAEKAAQTPPAPPAPPTEPDAPTEPPPPPAAPKSAVEEFGLDSPEAEAKRQERREKRLADEASRKAGKEPPVGVPEPA